MSRDEPRPVLLLRIDSVIKDTRVWTKQRLLNNATCIDLMVEMSASVARPLHLRCDDLQKATKFLSVL